MTGSLRYLWTAPATVLGLAAASLALARGGVAWVEGVIEAHGPLLRALLSRMPVPGGVAAVTLGHVVIARDQATLDETRAHERVHVRQYERWGPCFLPAYVVASLWALAQGGHVYFDNCFERDARRRSREDHQPRYRRRAGQGDPRA